LSSKLINENQVISLEDLNVAGMLGNRKLSKAISDASWSEFTRQLEYKANWNGRTIAKISPWYPSSQIYSSYRTVTGKKPLHIRKLTCDYGLIPNPISSFLYRQPISITYLSNICEFLFCVWYNT
jgi:putative transposase